MKKSIKFISVLFAFLQSIAMNSQTVAVDAFNIVINNICIIRSSSTSTINMNMTVPQAGQSIADVTNATTYLQVTSIAPEGETRKVTSIISTGTKPSGTTLMLAVSACTTGAGTRGSAYTITLNNTNNQTIIDGIGSCYTNTTTTSGYKLTYTWKADLPNYALITATTSPTPISITHTIATAN